jgi:hypothetical protein
MENAQIREIVEQIMDNTSRDDAIVRIGGYDEELELIGSRNGILRLAAELLTATYADASPAHLFEQAKTHPAPCPVLIKSIVIEQTPPEPPAPQSWRLRWRDKMAKLGCLALLAALAVCAIVGLFTLLKLL